MVGSIGRVGQMVGRVGRAPTRRDPLAAWRKALAGRSTSPASVVCIGDSLTEGRDATDLTTNYVSLMRDGLREAYPTPGVIGGRGYINLLKPHSGTAVAPAYYPARRDSAAAVQYTDTHSPAQRVLKLNPGDQYTVTLQGTSCDIMWSRTATGGFTYSVDGGAAVAVSTAGAAADGRLTRVVLGALGPHTLVVNGGASQAWIDGVIEYDGDETAGIRVHNCGHSGIRAAQWAGRTDPQSWPLAVAALAPDLVILSLGTNDWGDDTSAATFGANLRTIIGLIRAAGVSPSFCLHMVHRANYSGKVNDWSAYVAQAYAVAAELGCSVWDDSVGMPNVAGDTNGYYSDSVHLTNSGHARVAELGLIAVG